MKKTRCFRFLDLLLIQLEIPKLKSVSIPITKIPYPY